MNANYNEHSHISLYSEFYLPAHAKKIELLFITIITVRVLVNTVQAATPKEGLNGGVALTVDS